ETLFVPVRERGAVIRLEIQTREPLEIEAEFVRDFALEWPASLGGTYMNWDPGLNAFILGEEQKKYSAIVGSPTAREYREEYFSNYSGSQASSFRLGRVEKGRQIQLIVIAGSLEGQAEAERNYRHLLTDYAGLLQQSANY